MTTITYSLEQWQNLLHQVIPVEQLEARAREFAHRIGLVAQSQETLAAQYAAEQKAVNAKAQAEFIERLDKEFRADLAKCSQYEVGSKQWFDAIGEVKF